MARTKKVSPFTTEGFGRYVFVNVFPESLGAFMFGFGLGYMIWGLARLFFVFEHMVFELSMLPSWKGFALPLGLVFGGIAAWKSSRRESYKWDQFNQRQTTIKPDPIKIEAKSGFEVEGPKEQEFKIWVPDENNPNKGSGKVFRTLALTPAKALVFKAYLVSTALGSNKNLTRDYALKSGISRKSWETFRDIGREFKIMGFREDDEPFSLANNERAKQFLLFIAERIDV